jgi:two-component system, sensor histidine kinase PdtaS
MDFNDLAQNQDLKIWLLTAAIGLGVTIVLLFAIFKTNGNRKAREQHEKSSLTMESNNKKLAAEMRKRIIHNINTLSRIVTLSPVIPGNTPDYSTLESRNRAKCLAMIIDALPHDTKGQGVRMAEFTHQLADNLVQAYGRDDIVNVSIDVNPIILDVDSAVDAGLILNELISNALQYAPVPGEKSKVNIVFKERENKLFINVADNGTGMKSPYIPQFSFGLQLVNTLVHKRKGEMIITSRPGTRVEIALSEYEKAEREVFVTPTTRVY